MFEVGKKYITKFNREHGKSIIEVMAATKQTAYIKRLNPNVDTLHLIGDEHCYSQEVFEEWKEYKEPRTITRWVNVYEERKGSGTLTFGAMYEDETKARANGHCNGAIATIPVSYTEPH